MRRILFFLSSTLLVLSACSRPDRDLPPRYRSLPVPETTLASREARARGRALFLTGCALCHGVGADGHGARQEGFSSPPRDFTDPDWGRRTSPRRLFFTIREGVRGTAMPAWGSLSDGDCWDLVAYLRAVSRQSQ